MKNIQLSGRKPMKKRLWFWTLVLICVLISIAEGYFFYAPYGVHDYLKIMMIITNAGKTFFLNPSISIASVLKTLTAESDRAMVVTAYAYSTVVFVAPVCTATAVFNTVRLFLRRSAWGLAGRKTEHIYLFGYHADTRCLLEHQPKCRRLSDHSQVIHLVTGQDVPERVEMDYLSRGIVVHRTDLLLPDGQQLRDTLEELHIEQARQIILFEESPAHNFSLFLSLQKCSDLLNENVSFYLSSNSLDMRRVIENLGCQPEPGIRDTISTHDLTLFSIPELKIRQMFSLCPLYASNVKRIRRGIAPDWNVHMLIVGFGSVGQEALQQTIQLGAISSGSRVLIDVVDYHAPERISMLKTQFHPDYLDPDTPENEIAISGDRADGELRIRFHQMDVREAGFRDVLEDIVTERDPITYVAVCTENSDITIHCVLEIQRFLLQRNYPSGAVPVAARLEFNQQIADFVLRANGTFHEVFPIGVNQDVLQLEQIFDRQSKLESLAYNETYNRINDVIFEQRKGIRLDSIPPSTSEQLSEAKIAWDKLPYYKKESNLWLSYHNSTKKMLLACMHWLAHPELPDSFARYLNWGADPLHPYQVTAPPEDVTAAVTQLLTAAPRQDGHIIIDDSLVDLGSEALRELLRVEHRRWCYSMALNSWSYTPGDRKDEQLQLSPYMCSWAILRRDHPQVCINDIIPLLVLFAGKDRDN